MSIDYTLTMDSVQELLGRFARQEPDEVTAIRRYIVETFESPVRIALHEKTLIITVESAALANTLRFRTLELQKIAKTSKRLVFRIG